MTSETCRGRDVLSAVEIRLAAVRPSSGSANLLRSQGAEAVTNLVTSWNDEWQNLSRHPIKNQRQCSERGYSDDLSAYLAVNSMLTSLDSPIPRGTASSCHVRLDSLSTHGEPTSKYRRPLAVTPIPVRRLKVSIAVLTLYSWFSRQYPTKCFRPEPVSRIPHRTSVTTGWASTAAIALFFIGYPVSDSRRTMATKNAVV